MKSKILNLVLVSILLAIGFGSCSNHDYNPEDYMVSIFSGQYGVGGYNLNVTENEESKEYIGYVRFFAKNLEAKMEGDFTFVDILPGESKREFKNVSLIPIEDGFSFSINYVKDGENIDITGTLVFGLMTINITTNPS